MKISCPVCVLVAAMAALVAAEWPILLATLVLAFVPIVLVQTNPLDFREDQTAARLLVYVAAPVFPFFAAVLAFVALRLRARQVEKRIISEEKKALEKRIIRVQKKAQELINERVAYIEGYYNKARLALNEGDHKEAIKNMERIENVYKR